MTLTHASFFSGAGGLDMGLERAGWTTVSFSEIDPYASAVLAHRWPGVPNLGSIVDIRADVGDGRELGGARPRELAARRRRSEPRDARPACGWRDALLWTGGFPCQDLSVAGKRRGIVEGSRSGLAITFLDLVERHRPPAIILENVPGLLSSHAGRDFGTLLGRLGELGYWWAYRVLDARYFGVPQRRRRVFIVALHAGIGATADSPAEVLSVGSRCDRHPATGSQAGEGTAGGATPGVDIARTITGSSGHRHDDDTDTLVAETVRTHPRPGSNSIGSVAVVGASPDPGGDGAPDGLAGRLDDRAGVAIPISGDALRGEGTAQTPSADAEGRVRLRDPGLGVGREGQDAFSITATEPGAVAVLGFSQNQRGEVVTHDIAHQLTTGGGKPGEGYAAVMVSALDTAQGGADDNDAQAGRLIEVAPTLLAPGPEGGRRDKMPVTLSGPAGDAPLLPDGLDSHRYRCCGNGVVAPVAEFIGERLRVVVERLLDERAA